MTVVICYITDEVVTNQSLFINIAIKIIAAVFSYISISRHHFLKKKKTFFSTRYKKNLFHSMTIFLVKFKFVRCIFFVSLYINVWINYPNFMEINLITLIVVYFFLARSLHFVNLSITKPILRPPLRRRIIAFRCRVYKDTWFKLFRYYHKCGAKCMPFRNRFQIHHNKR